ncbi:outer membrane beta-barrel protein [Psittacicella hinzii]|uniref:Outer membrane protein beta-barrel domain-containing protein n=1 Tax=Psittacicella hinzii TaxID=2028575 RepID=A0A3A1YSX2_9GAMM|nr:outer membrane beta-barrel protein [Psittacicella hinzii]RIY39137.1 hypothetical protein CKF58_02810 [Psittacicella hinzii]
MKKILALSTVSLALASFALPAQAVKDHTLNLEFGIRFSNTQLDEGKTIPGLSINGSYLFKLYERQGFGFVVGPELYLAQSLRILYAENTNSYIPYKYVSEMRYHISDYGFGVKARLYVDLNTLQPYVGVAIGRAKNKVDVNVRLSDGSKYKYSDNTSSTYYALEAGLQVSNWNFSLRYDSSKYKFGEKNNFNTISVVTGYNF